MRSDDYQAFRDLGALLEKKEPTIDLVSETPHHISFLADCFSGKRRFRTKVYDFDNNITIVKEQAVETGSKSRRVSGFPECKWESHETNGQWSVFYVLQNDKPVTGKRDAKKLIKQATGIYLPKADLTWGKYHRHSYDSSDRIFTSPKKDRSFFCLNEQDDEHELSRYCFNLIKNTEELSEKTGISKETLFPNITSKEIEVSKEKLMPCFDKIKGIIESYGTLYIDKYEKKDRRFIGFLETIAASRKSSSRRQY